MSPIYGEAVATPKVFVGAVYQSAGVFNVSGTPSVRRYKQFRIAHLWKLTTKLQPLLRQKVLIVAPLDIVWSVQTKIDEWSRWNPDISKVNLRGPLSAGTEFHWKSGSSSITSILQEVEPERRITWTGRTLGIRAIHVWTLQQTDKGVLVRTEESFEGILVNLLAKPMRRMLRSSLDKAVQALKIECERRIRAGAS